jgi:hypothetical protein
MKAWYKDRNSFWRAYRAQAPEATSPHSGPAYCQHLQMKFDEYRRIGNGLMVPPAPAAVPNPSSPDFTAETDAVAIFKQLVSSSNSAGGMDGIAMKFFKAADYQLGLPPEEPQYKSPGFICGQLEALYAAISRAAEVPSSFQTTLIVPIYKGKGDHTDDSSYRPLSIPDAICRIWGATVEHALTEWLTERNLLPDGMFGFRPGRGCRHPLFVLRHVTDRSRAIRDHAPVCAAFMDLSGAYDSVNRPRLWSKLEHLGFHPNTMVVFQHLYANNQGRVKVAGKLTVPLPVDCGLRQGDPLSVTLFNLYIRDLPEFIHSRVPDAGVPLDRGLGPTTTGAAAGMAVPGFAASPISAAHPHGLTAGASTTAAAVPPDADVRLTALRITDLGYADDIALVDTDPDRLQGMLDAFETYCRENGLIINPEKSEVVVFTEPRRNAHAHRVWRVVGRDLPRSATFKYLGVTFNGQQPIEVSAAGNRLAAAKASYATVLQHLQRLGARKTPALRRHLYSIVSRPAGDYAAEVWATALLPDAWDLTTPHEVHHRAVLRRALGVPNSTDNMVVYHETASQPLMLGWLRRTLKFWNQLVSMQHSPLCQSVLAENVRLGVTHRHPNMWSRQLLTALQFATGNVEQHWACRLSQLLPLDVEAIMLCAGNKWRAHALSKLEGHLEPDNPACLHRPVVCHHVWFHPPTALSHTPKQPCPWYLAAGIPAAHQRALALLRTCNFPVRSNTGRHQGIPFASRVCQRCSMGCVDTEPHCLLECPDLAPLRTQFAMLDFRQPLHDFLAHTTSRPSLLFGGADMLRPVAKYIHEVHSHLLRRATGFPPPPVHPPVLAGGPVAPRVSIPRPPLPVGYDHYLPDATFRVLRTPPLQRDC